MSAIPEKLGELLRELAGVDEATRADILIELSDEFVSVPGEIAEAPYPEEARVPGCESEVFAFSRVVSGQQEAQESPRLEFFFAVENPQGISAMAMAAIVQQTVNGSSCEEILAIPTELAYEIFGRTLSMGKGQGLMSMVAVLHALARRHRREGRSS
ncbi:SufE family protein [bacterium]|nr:SufE family protein [bacterium]